MRLSACMLFSALSMMGCTSHAIIDYPPDPDAGADAATDAGDAGSGGAGGDMQSSLCNGACVPPAPLGWSGPALLWFGPPDRVPDSPPGAPNIGYEGFADLDPLPALCPACVCDAPEASCALPLGWAAGAATCADIGPGTAVTSFTAPDGWDGECTVANAIPAGTLCDGQPCVQSLSIEAPVVVTGACAARVDEPAPIPDFWAWVTQAKAFIPGAYTQCEDAQTCLPAPPPPGLPPPDGFSICIYSRDERTCPDNYAVKHVFYEGLADSRACTPCSCGKPEGASCSIMASVFTDDACTVLQGANILSSTDPFCVVVPSGIGLGSKSATVVAVDPGACAPSGGEAIGEVQPTAPSTFCCIVS